MLHAILADVTLPDGNGMEWVRPLRKEHRCPPILFITSHSEMEYLRKGFEMGAADYLRKPFEEEELILRVKRALNDFNTGNGQERTLGEYLFNPVTHALRYKDHTAILSRLQGGVLKELSHFPGEVVHKDYLLKKYWGDANYFTSRNLDSVVVKLRAQFKNDPSVLFMSLKREGYRMVILKG